MARHYSQNKKDRMDESRGMKKSGKRRSHNPGSDSMMMPKDAADNQHDHMYEQTQLYHMGKGYYGPGYGHPSNLPPYPDMKYYPKETKYLNTGDYPDTIREIDHDDTDNLNNLNRQPSKSMY